MSKQRSAGTRRPRQRPVFPVLEIGQRLRDSRDRRAGVVMDLARQYSHPKAQPVHNYLVRWDDGQVEAISEAALGGAHGIELDD